MYLKIHRLCYVTLRFGFLIAASRKYFGHADDTPRHPRKTTYINHVISLFESTRSTGESEVNYCNENRACKISFTFCRYTFPLLSVLGVCLARDVQNIKYCC